MKACPNIGELHIGRMMTDEHIDWSSGKRRAETPRTSRIKRAIHLSVLSFVWKNKEIGTTA